MTAYGNEEAASKNFFGANPTMQTWQAEVEEINNPFHYCGEYLDSETGNYYLRARYYDPEAERFISEDSYKGEAINPLSLNYYTYCSNNPIIYSDPTGHWQVGDENLPNWAQDAIGTYTSLWNDANAAGDTTGMDAAHIAAQAVRDFVELYYQSRNDWGAEPSQEPLTLVTGTFALYYDTIVFHHTERLQYESITNLQQYFFSRGFSDIGYHFIIGADGTVYEGRSLSYEGGHVENNNTGKIGIAIMGNFEPNNSAWNNLKNWVQGASATYPTDAQIKSAKQMAQFLSDAYGIDMIGGHKDFKPGTLCPGKRLTELLSEIYRDISYR